MEGKKEERGKGKLEGNPKVTYSQKQKPRAQVSKEPELCFTLISASLSSFPPQSIS